MFRRNYFIVSKGTAIILLIAAFSIAGIVSCSADATNPSESQEEATRSTRPKRSLPSWSLDYAPKFEESPKPTFPEDTYMTVYTPWRGENYPRVSWQDSETLLLYWKEMMSRKWSSERWFIKGAAYGNWDPSPEDWKDPNFFYYPPNNSYYYFDANFDLVYYSDIKKASIKIMKLMGATIVRWNKARNDNSKNYIGTWTVGGIYQTILTLAQINELSKDLSIKKDLHFFMRADHMPSRNNKPLQVITMNLGYNDQWYNEFGVDNYYHTKAGDYNNITAFTNKTPQELDSFLNEKANLSWNWNLDWYNWRFFTRKLEPWHFSPHPDTGLISRK